MFWNKVRLVASANWRQCIKILKKWQALDSAQNGHEVHKKQPNDNSKVNRTQVIHFQISTSAESNFAA